MVQAHVRYVGPCPECGKAMFVSPRDFARGVKYERHPWCESTPEPKPQPRIDIPDEEVPF